MQFKLLISIFKNILVLNAIISPLINKVLIDNLHMTLSGPIILKSICYHHFLWFNDNNTIWSVSFGCINETIDQGRSYVECNIDISDCYFSRFSVFSGDDGRGGVIYVSGGSYSMSVNCSMFYNCICSSDGGAIRFSSNSNSYLRMICANRCSCGDSKEGHFAYIRAYQMNHIEYLSVSYCSNITSGNCPLYWESGNQKGDNTNISLNNAYMYAGIYVPSTALFTSSHCTYSNNKAYHSICIRLSFNSGTMSSANIIHNNSPLGNGVIHNQGLGKKLMYCIFYNNQNYLFYVSSGSLEVSHCFIDHSPSSISYETAVSTSTNNTFTKRITYQIQFFKSLHCNADVPLPMRTHDSTLMKSMTFQSTIDETPMKSHEKTLMNTQNETPMNTQNETPLNTHEETIKETAKETIHRSYAECVCSCQIAKRRNLNVIFSFIYPIEILMIS